RLRQRGRPAGADPVCAAARGLFLSRRSSSLFHCGIIIGEMHRKLKPPSLLRRAGVSFLLGLIMFLLGVLLENTLDRAGIRGWTALVDDLLIGMIAGLLVFAYELHRYNAILRRLRVIAEMNHHVRNALQPILYSPYMKEQAQQIQVIQEGTQRIQWALREVLAGDNDEEPPVQGSSAAA